MQTQIKLFKGSLRRFSFALSQEEFGEVRRVKLQKMLHPTFLMMQLEKIEVPVTR